MHQTQLIAALYLLATILTPTARAHAQPQTASHQAHPVQPITAILGAYGDEITLLLARTENKKERIIQQFHFTEGTLNGRKVVIALTGIGKVNAAISTTLVIEHYHPAEVLFSGIAGGVDTALSPGDLVIANTVAYHDYGTLLPDSLQLDPTRNPVTHTANPIYFPCNDSLVAIAERVSRQVVLEKADRLAPHPPRIVSGIIVTGDVFISSRPATQRLWRQMKAEATDMEGAAIAQTCWQQRIPFLVIRSLSDDADSNAGRDIRNFYQVAARNAAAMVMAITRQLAITTTKDKK